MNNEYVIINKTEWLKVMEELEKRASEVFDSSIKYQPQIDIIKQTLSQSTPLIPEIEKAVEYGIRKSFGPKKHSEIREDYITNLKLDI